MTPARARVLAAAQGGLVHLKRELAQAAGVSVGVIDGLVDEGTLETVAPRRPSPVAEAPDPGPSPAPRSRDGAARRPRGALVAAVARGRQPPVTLLEGVTGSGKTEVYFEAVAEALRQGRQALILMPEIALTGAVPRPLRRAASACGPAAWHSGVAGARRERLYAGIAAGEVQVVAGARSALFLPLRRSRPHRRR